MKNSLPKGIIQKVVFALFFITGAIFYAQDKTYASSQSYETNGLLCLGCSVANPQNAVGNNEVNYTTLKIPVGIGGKIEQNLIFPTTAIFNRVTIGIGTLNTSLSIGLLESISVESFLGDNSNNDNKTVSNNLLKLGQVPDKGTIEFLPTKPFNRIKITLHGGLLGLNDELRIYYAYHQPFKKETCDPTFEFHRNDTDLIFMPRTYHLFDGNTIDQIYFDAIDTFIPFLPVNSPNPNSNPSIIFNNNIAVCGKSVTALPGAPYGIRLTLVSSGPNISDDNPKSILFWARVEDGGSIKLWGLMKLIITSTTATASMEYDEFEEMHKIYANNDPGVFNHYILTYSGTAINDVLQGDSPTNELCLYKNGVKIGCITPKSNAVSLWSHVIELDKAQIDEAMIYHLALRPEEAQAIACSYGVLPNCTPGISTPASKVAAPRDTFTVSPNPTTGEITINGNILLIGSDISIRNTSGTEVYHSAFRSRTFELPATLPGGVYMLTLQTKDKKVYTRKIILTR